MRKVNNMSEKKIEGYWYSKYSPQYPMPIKNVLTQDQSNTIYKLIKKRERSANKILYRGFSHSRIDDSRLGCAEYETDTWRWPGDFAGHYVLKYGVRPSDEFLKYIGYKERTDQ